MHQPLSEETPFASQLAFVWHEHSSGFAVLPRLGKLSVIAFFTSFLILITAGAVFLEVFSRWRDDLLPYKFGLLLFFIFLAPVFSSLAAVFFRRLLRGLWGELTYSLEDEVIRFSRKGHHQAFHRQDLRALEIYPVPASGTSPASGQLVFVLRSQDDQDEQARLFYFSHPDTKMIRTQAQQLARAWQVDVMDFSA